MLEASGCDVDKARKAGKNMVFVAAECGNVEALEMLVSAGAKIDAPATTGETPTHVAQAKGHAAAHAWLVARGGVATAPAKLCVYEPCATNKDGKWPLPPLPYPYDSLVVRPSTPSFSPRHCVSNLRIAQGADVLLSAALSLTSTTRRCTSTTTS